MLSAAAQNQESISAMAEAYLAALIRQSTQAATAVIDQALSQGLPLRSIYLDIILTGQKQVGELWAKGELSIANEHVATQITIAELSRLRTYIRPRLSRKRTVASVAVTADNHTIAARVVADFFLMDGWEVRYLGGNLAAEDISAYVLNEQIDVLALSVTLTDFLEPARKVIDSLKNEPGAPFILLGGAAVISEWRKASNLGADLAVKNIDQALMAARRHFSLENSVTSLPNYLQELGQRIKRFRKLRKIRQQELATRAKIDRAYLSNIENGHQNVSLATLFQLAQALEVDFEDLLVERLEYQHA